MIFLVLAIFSIVFIEMFIALKIIPDAQGVLKLSAQSVEVMKSKEMTDREKESFMRTNSLNMLKATAKFIFKFLLIVGVLVLLSFLIELYSTELSEAVIASFSSIKHMVIITVAAMFYVWIRNVVSKKL